MNALDLAPRIFDIVRALASDPGDAVTDALSAITNDLAAQAGRIQREAEHVANEAISATRSASELAQQAVANAERQRADTVAELTARTEQGRAAVQRAIADGEQAAASAARQADQLRSTALAAALDAAERERIEQRAAEMVAAAQVAATAARTRAEQELDAVTAELAGALAAAEAALLDLRNRATEAAAAAQRAVDEAATRVQQEVARLTAAAQTAAAQVTALPGQAVALAEDARRQLLGALGNTATLVGLITQALVYLKNEAFPDIDELQVVAYNPVGAAKPGIGLSWVQGPTSALLAYVPEMGGPLGTLVVKTARSDGQPVELSVGSPVTLRLTASGNQELTIPFGAVPAPAGDGHVGLAVGFDTSALRLDERFVQATAGVPAVSLTLRSTGGAWHYRVGAELASAGWHVDFARLFDPIPNLLPIADLGETRTFRVALEDGVFGFTEVNAA